jgi:hypothetical protein
LLSVNDDTAKNASAAEREAGSGTDIRHRRFSRRWASRAFAAVPIRASRGRTLPLALLLWVSLPYLALATPAAAGEASPPLAKPDRYLVRQGETLAAAGGGAPPGVLANDEGALHASLVRPPRHGTLHLAPDGCFTYAPHPNFIGTDGFSYSASRPLAPESLIGPEDEWKYLHPLDGVDPAAADPDFHATWHTLAFGDSAWESGSGLMGYGIISGPDGVDPIDTAIGLPPSGARRAAYFRRAFTGAAGVYDLFLELSRDDGAIIYLNGRELLREGGAPGSEFTTSPNRFFLKVERGAVEHPEEALVRAHTIAGVELAAGPNVLAISLHNSYATDSDMGLRFRLLALTGAHEGAIADVEIEVEDGNRPPVLAADGYTLGEDTVLETTTGRPALFANDGLLDGSGEPFDPLLEVLIGGAPAGMVTPVDPRTGHFSFVPEPEFSGRTELTYRVRDKDGASEPAVVTIEVAPDLVLEPFARLEPLGSSAFASLGSRGEIGGGETRDAVFALAAGESLSAVLSSPAEGGVLPRLTLYAPGGATLGTAAATAPGERIELRNLRAPAAGVYRCIVENAQAAGGAFTLDILVNAVPDGDENHTEGKALDLEPSFLALGSFGAARAAVIGSLAGPAGAGASDWYRFRLEDGEEAEIVVSHPEALPPSVRLLDAAGKERAAAVPASSTILSIAGFRDGTADLLPEDYLLAVEGSAERYTLLVGRATRLEIDPDDTLARPLPELDAFHVATGHLGPRETPVSFAVIGDYGDESAASHAVAAMVRSWKPDFIVTVGDNNYGSVDPGDRSWSRNIGALYGEYIRGRADGKHPEQTSFFQRGRRGGSARRAPPRLGRGRPPRRGGPLRRPRGPPRAWRPRRHRDGDAARRRWARERARSRARAPRSYRHAGGPGSERRGRRQERPAGLRGARPGDVHRASAPGDGRAGRVPPAAPAGRRRGLPPRRHGERRPPPPHGRRPDPTLPLRCLLRARGVPPLPRCRRCERRRARGPERRGVPPQLPLPRRRGAAASPPRLRGGPERGRARLRGVPRVLSGLSLNTSMLRA